MIRTPQLLLLFILLTSPLLGQKRPKTTTSSPRTDIGRIFKANKVDGGFVLFDAGGNRFTRYNPKVCSTRYIPASTFKIYNSLVALETGVVANEHTVIRWDSVKRWVPNWNQDLDMATAFKLSAVWFYQELARRIGPERMQGWMSREPYGNSDISGGIDSFWLTGGLRISPDEQIPLLQHLHDGTLSFSERSMRVVREIMVEEKTDDYTLSWKTGWATSNPNIKNIGWIVGWLERQGNVYYFALNIQSNDPNFDIPATRTRMLHEILQKLTLLP